MIKRFDGSSSFIAPSTIKRWTGSAWQAIGFAKRWTGSAWVDVWNSLTVTIGGGFSTSNLGGPNRRSTGSFSAVVLPAGSPTPSSYSWGISDYGGALTLTSATNAVTLSMVGPAYDFSGMTTAQQVDLQCTMVIGGVTYITPVQSFYYTTQS